MSYNIEIDTPAGTLHVEYTEALLSQIREAFELPPDTQIPDEFITAFIQRELVSAVDKLGVANVPHSV